MQDHDSMIVCQNCKKQVNSDTNYCSYCGKELTNRNIKPKKELKTKEKKEIPHKGILITIILSLTIIAVYCIVLQLDLDHYKLKSNNNTKSISRSNGVLATMYAHKTVNIRKGKGTNTSIVGQLKTNDIVKADISMNDWLEIYKNGESKGFVFRKLLKSYPLPDYEIISYYWDTYDYYTLVWNVKVKNNTLFSKFNTRIEFTTYDINGKKIKSYYTYISELTPEGITTSKTYSDRCFGNEYSAFVIIVQY